MAEDCETILDHVDDIRVPGNPFKEPVNEYWALVCLNVGLESLYAHASKLEEQVRKEIDPEGKVHGFSQGRIPGLQTWENALLTSMFHWYAVSACNYARLVGAIARQLDEHRPTPPEYIKKVMPEVLSFRDKIAAHFAWSTMNERDNEAERASSVFPQLSWSGDALKVRAFTLYMRKGDKVSDSAAIRPWSVTKVHKELRLRYWPERAE
jgi:hypothetical protein